MSLLNLSPIPFLDYQLLTLYEDFFFNIDGICTIHYGLALLPYFLILALNLLGFSSGLILFAFFFLFLGVFGKDFLVNSGVLGFSLLGFGWTHTLIKDRGLSYGGFSLFFWVLLGLLGFITMVETMPYSILIKPSLHWLLIISISYYLTMVISSFFNSPSFFISSYVVSGQSLLGYFFLCPIEVLSQSLRPLTLAFRMSLNLTSGVILMKFAWIGFVLLLGLSEYITIEAGVWSSGVIAVFSYLSPFFMLFAGGMGFICWSFLVLFEGMTMLLHVFIFCILVLLYEGDHGSLFYTCCLMEMHFFLAYLMELVLGVG